MQKILIAALCLSLFLAGCSGNGLGSSSNPDSSSASSQSAPEEVLDCGEYIDGNTGEVLDTSPLIQFAAAAQEGKAAKVYIQKTTAEGDPHRVHPNLPGWGIHSVGGFPGRPVCRGGRP